MSAPKKRSSKKREAPPSCPTCASTDVVSIVWGLPDAGLFEKAEAGAVVIGGCVVSDDDPAWHCKACGKDFGRSAHSGSVRR